VDTYYGVDDTSQLTAKATAAGETQHL